MKRINLFFLSLLACLLVGTNAWGLTTEPEAGKCYTIKLYNNNGAEYGNVYVDGGNNMKARTSGSGDVFYVETDNSGNKYLKHVSSGNYLQNNKATNSFGTTKAKMTFDNGADDGFCILGTSVLNSSSQTERYMHVIKKDGGTNDYFSNATDRNTEFSNLYSTNKGNDTWYCRVKFEEYIPSPDVVVTGVTTYPQVLNSSDADIIFNMTEGITVAVDVDLNTVNDDEQIFLGASAMPANISNQGSIVAIGISHTGMRYRQSSSGCWVYGKQYKVGRNKLVYVFTKNSKIEFYNIGVNTGTLNIPYNTWQYFDFSTFKGVENRQIVIGGVGYNNKNDNNKFTKGTIHSIQVFNGALKAEQIQSIKYSEEYTVKVFVNGASSSEGGITPKGEKAISTDPIVNNGIAKFELGTVPVLDNDFSINPVAGMLSTSIIDTNAKTITVNYSNNYCRIKNVSNQEMIMKLTEGGMLCASSETSLYNSKDQVVQLLPQAGTSTYKLKSLSKYYAQTQEQAEKQITTTINESDAQAYYILIGTGKVKTVDNSTEGYHCFCTTHTAKTFAEGSHAIYYNDGSGKNNMISTWAPLRGDGVNEHPNSYWAIEAIPYYPLTIATSGYSTLYLDYPSFIPEGITVFYATTADDTKVTLTSTVPENGVIPANQGFVIKGTPGTTYDFVKAGSAEYSGTNYMKGSITGVDMSKVSNAYILASDGKFYSCNEGTLAANKAYLQLPSSTAKSLTIVFDEETGINRVDGSTLKVQSSNGKYFENGRVVIIKNNTKYNVAGQCIK